MKVGIERVTLNATLEQYWDMVEAAASLQKNGFLPGVEIEIAHPQPTDLAEDQKQVIVGGAAFAAGHEDIFWAAAGMTAAGPNSSSSAL